MLLQAVDRLTAGRTVNLEVAANNISAVNLYTGLGYKVVGEVTDKGGNVYYKMEKK